MPLQGMDTEGFPLVALESQLVGTPVVGYANGGLPELVADCGRLVPEATARRSPKPLSPYFETTGYALGSRLGVRRG